MNVSLNVTENSVASCIDPSSCRAESCAGSPEVESLRAGSTIRSSVCCSLCVIHLHHRSGTKAKGLHFETDSAYYSCQILVHREFLAPPRAKLHSFPSLAICSNAARSLSHLLHTLQAQGQIQAAFYFAPFAVSYPFTRV